MLRRRKISRALGNLNSAEVRWADLRLDRIGFCIIKDDFGSVKKDSGERFGRTGRTGLGHNIARNDAAVRKLEGLGEGVALLHGPDATARVEEETGSC